MPTTLPMPARSLAYDTRPAIAAVVLWALAMIALTLPVTPARSAASALAGTVLP